MDFAENQRTDDQNWRVSMWRNWLIGFLGTWLIVAAFTIKGNLINELIVGVAVAVLGFWTAVHS